MAEKTFAPSFARVRILGGGSKGGSVAPNQAHFEVGRNTYGFLNFTQNDSLNDYLTKKGEYVDIGFYSVDDEVEVEVEEVETT
jgi:hypothetical protein